ncbi:MAG: hypothetical protein ACTSVF_03600 [Candidatus Asgardarchaeia archaeon]
MTSCKSFVIVDFGSIYLLYNSDGTPLSWEEAYTLVSSIKLYLEAQKMNSFVKGDDDAMEFDPEGEDS